MRMLAVTLATWAWLAPMGRCDEVPRAGEERDFEIAPGVKMRFCWIPPGKATIGSPKTEIGRYENEAEREFTSPGFWLGKYEVMQGEFEAVMGENPSYFKQPKPAAGKFRRNLVGSANYPVETVNFSGSLEFIKNCEVKGYTMDLPTVDEWEYACRGGLGNKRPFYWGNELSNRHAAIGRPYGTDEVVRNARSIGPVGRFKEVVPHPWGLCDMIGNVKEMTWDNAKRDPGFACGGGWHSAGAFCRPALRDKSRMDIVGIFGSTHMGQDRGFRVALFPEKMRGADKEPR